MTSNHLPILAAEIRRAHADVQEAAKTAAEHAITAGHALIEAKALLKHGEWLRWLRENCALAELTAQLYMKVARSGLESATVADLGLKFAADALLVHFADPWDEQPEESKRDWLIYMLFGIQDGQPLAAMEQYSRWMQRIGFDSPSMWIGAEGDEYRERLKMGGGRFSDEYKARWSDFLARHHGRSIGDIDAELQAVFDAEQPEPRRRRSRSS